MGNLCAIPQRCQVTGCTDRATIRGFCQFHYGQFLSLQQQQYYPPPSTSSQQYTEVPSAPPPSLPPQQSSGPEYEITCPRCKNYTIKMRAGDQRVCGTCGASLYLAPPPTSSTTQFKPQYPSYPPQGYLVQEPPPPRPSSSMGAGIGTLAAAGALGFLGGTIADNLFS
ncbi:hypothetical protein PAPYR_2215 [Paratrimastix pyriformis]|uniref:TFIIB-type domain-containing protein n=1 Tax=Paratrimastix pyriformis TaxID=342808 RepID=A0ABQ8URP3_9EUKA|nr:hypothetical protein PAPYR_2215 [Paratrimastix pyriformis]